jgi:hypothetical protein
VGKVAGESVAATEEAEQLVQGVETGMLLVACGTFATCATMGLRPPPRRSLLLFVQWISVTCVMCETFVISLLFTVMLLWLLVAAPLLVT